MAISHRRVQLVPSWQTVYNSTRNQCFALRVEARYAHELCCSLFAYRAIPLQPGQATQIAVYDHICSPVDLEEYPIGAPRINAIVPWFRLHYVDLLFRGRIQAEEAWQKIQDQVAALVESLNDADILAEAAPVWIGYQEHEDGSSIGSLDSMGSIC